MSIVADRILERLQARYPVLIDLSLGRLASLLERLGHPERRLPPVIHVAGTNGKGSTVATLRAIAEAAGLVVHATTSPHLVSVLERFRVSGRLVDEGLLARTLEAVERADPDATVTVFEAMIAAAFVLFADHPADLVLLEVGLGGTYDATNLVATPRVSAITSISLDHQAFLGDSLEAIAGEKAGIIKPQGLAVTGRQEPTVLPVLDRRAAECGASLWARDRDWTIEENGPGLVYADAIGRLDLPRPSLLGRHQIDNAGIAVAALRRSGLLAGERAYAAIAAAQWPARLQRLRGRLSERLPNDLELWLDGGHNPGAGHALAELAATAWRDRPLHLIAGLKESKDASGFLRPLLPLTRTSWAVREPGQHLAMSVESIIEASNGAARPGPDVVSAIDRIVASGATGRILICGSLHLAGEVLKMDMRPGLDSHASAAADQILV